MEEITYCTINYIPLNHELRTGAVNILQICPNIFTLFVFTVNQAVGLFV